mmetsp:Transcript_10997/g.20160  ORF Transcript_10997/g.20160 Transcript_10997/m.20160 type:complete len:502 (-) Transcript_10997:15-1520(-)|eukprot:CAMPEP_0201914892 /NCGR_PEP_ID=MMETSP0903-20130614/4960_1 /ASSEMBLY_ACC=CAM_ASM_000552 /TAXON_ID=420261 /ORGANISM="Thalassiosira antarctica, Strain CCMP982" /LENGTH=501 /DNA_ID=CAMNT_0048450373 /DNA_START=47 /DNA_END=1552 /DNA_ORIENTATION=+
MHGQKRSEYKSRLLNPEISSKLGTKAQQWNHLSHELLAQRRRLFGPSPPAGTAKPSPDILLTLTEKMLTVNPDPSHLWNIRREMLLHVPVPTAANDNAADNLDNSNAPSKSSSFEVQAELTLTAHCLQRNPKSYSSWHHRKWSLFYFLTHPTSNGGDDPSSPESDAPKRHLNNMKAILQSELDLCADFLQLDERNFHCWNYRRFVVALLGSCGSTSSLTSVQDADIAVKPDTELFNGSWFSWLNQSKVMMGAQLSRSAGSAVGMIAVNTEQDDEAASVARSIMPLSKQELEEIITNEWDFTNSKIQDNFSNGSAFHYRSKLLPLVLELRLSSDSGDSEGDDSNPSSNERYDAILSLAREEWENLVLNAIFTEPDDQTPWWYHRFIVSWAKPSDDLDDEMVDGYEALLFEMADSLRDLLEVEKENDVVGNDDKKDESKGAKCKWAYIGLHLVLSTLLESKSMDKEEAVNLREEAEECLTELMRIDPNRRERYQNLAAEINGV